MIAKGKLVAFDRPENLEKHLLSLNEIVLTTDAPADETLVLLNGIDHITDLSVKEESDGLATAHIKTDLSDVYTLSRAVFSAFAAAGKVLLEMTVKKANLEDIFLELTDSDPAEAGEPVKDAENTEESEAAEE